MRLRSLDLPMFPHPCLYAGDFNCCHADWGYDENSPDGECLVGWASINVLPFYIMPSKHFHFHINNREAKRELKVYNNGRLLPFCPTPTYLGVKLDRSLTFRHHLVALRKKLSSRVTLLRRLVGS